MTWVPDSTQAGYLGPDPPPAPAPLQGDAWEDWLHDVLAGITGLPDDLVRPRWQAEPPNRPDIETDWLAFGMVDARFDFTPFIRHVDDEGGGHDELQEHEVDTILCSFYGPGDDYYASLLRRGFYLDQNRAACRKAGVGLVEIESVRRAPEYFMNRWWKRSDMNVVLRREIRLNYPVRTILRAQGPILANEFGDGVYQTEFDTARVP